MDDSFIEETQRMQKRLYSNDIIVEPDHLPSLEANSRSIFNDKEEDDIMGEDNENPMEEIMMDAPLRTSSPLNELTTSDLTIDKYLQDLGSIISATSLESNSNSVSPEEQEEEEDENGSLSSLSSLSSMSSLVELDSDMFFYNPDESQQQEEEVILPFDLPILLPPTPEIIELLLLTNPFFIIPDFEVEDNDVEFESWLNLDYQE